MFTEKELCDYETCVALKKLNCSYTLTEREYAGKGGLRCKCEPPFISLKHEEGTLLSRNYFLGAETIKGTTIPALSLYEAQKWLREEKNLHIEVRWFCNMWYEYEVKEAEGKVLAEGSAFPTYEEALSTAVRMAVEHLKEK